MSADTRSIRQLPSDLYALFAPGVELSVRLLERNVSSAWLGWRRLLFIAFIIACCVTFMATAQFSVGSVLSAMLYWSYVPAIQCLALLIACKGQAANVSRSRLIDTYFVSHTPWLVWLCGWALLTNWLPTKIALNMFDVWLLGGGAVVLIWSLWIDWHFFRCIAQHSGSHASRTLVIQRLLSWPVIIWVFSFGSLWPGILEHLQR